MNYEQILYGTRGRVAIVTLNRPEKLNAWTSAMMAESRHAIEQANADPAVRAVVFTGAGRAFCAGADVGGWAQQIDAGQVPQDRATEDGEDWVSFLRRMPKPLIAAVNGVAVGIGVTHVLPFDVRIGSENARFGMFFVRMGIVPELASSHFLAQLVGTGRALEWCLTGRIIPAEEAKDAGLITEVVPAGSLLDRAIEVGEQIGGHSPKAIARIKELFNQNAVDGDVRRVMQRESEALAFCRTTWEHREAVSAFMEKRAPDFTSR